MNYSLLCWGFSIHRLNKLQKKAIRVICLSKYNAHTDPLFKTLHLLKVGDLFNVNALKFVHKYHNNKLPPYFHGMLDSSFHTHNYNTRNPISNLPIPKRSTTKKSIRYFIPSLMKDTHVSITDKILTHSLQGFGSYAKKHYISNYNAHCDIENCYICGITENA